MIYQEQPFFFFFFPLSLQVKLNSPGWGLGDLVFLSDYFGLSDD